MINQNDDILYYVDPYIEYPDNFENLTEEKLSELKEKVIFSCRVHPIDWFHETGCSCYDWAKEQLIDAIKGNKVKDIIYQKWILKLEAEIQKLKGACHSSL